mgnify:CR=1 FL=1
MASSPRVDMVLSAETIRELNALDLAISAGFDAKRIDKALNAASLETARAMVKPVRAAAPKNTGRLARAVWAMPVMRDKPGAYVGIRAGKSRTDRKGAYYRYIVTSGVARVPYVIKAKDVAPGLSWAQVGAGIKLPDGSLRKSVVRTQKIPGRPFVYETVSKNLNRAKEIFEKAMVRIISAGVPSKGSIKIERVSI